MSRSSRALVAGGLAAALLVGSGGTFARWYDEKSINAGSVTTGRLSLSTVGDSTWLINKADEGADADPSVPFDPAIDTIVPGDVVSYTTTVKLNIKGKNIKATFALLDGGGTAWDNVSTDTQADCGAGVNQAALTAADNGATCTVTTTFVYEFGAGNATSALPEYNGGNTENIHGEGWTIAPAEQGAVVSLSNAKLVLEQNLRP